MLFAHISPRQDRGCGDGRDSVAAAADHKQPAWVLSISGPILRRSGGGDEGGGRRELLSGRQG